MLTILLSYYRIIEHDHYGVWLSLARAPGLGPGGRRFESCYPEFSRIVAFKPLDRQDRMVKRFSFFNLLHIDIEILYFSIP